MGLVRAFKHRVSLGGVFANVFTILLYTVYTTTLAPHTAVPRIVATRTRFLLTGGWVRQLSYLVVHLSARGEQSEPLVGLARCRHVVGGSRPVVVRGLALPKLRALPRTRPAQGN